MLVLAFVLALVFVLLPLALCLLAGVDVALQALLLGVERLQQMGSNNETAEAGAEAPSQDGLLPLHTQAQEVESRERETERETECVCM